MFVSDLMREAAITSHGLPRATCTVIPNVVRTADLARDKHESALKTVGFVGIVPQLKRLDRAVDLMEQLVAVDPEFSLRVKGKRPEDYEWMHKRPEELEWYRACYRRVDELNQRAGRRISSIPGNGWSRPSTRWRNAFWISRETRRRAVRSATTHTTSRHPRSTPPPSMSSWTAP